jgi:hypothetical protein
MKLSCPLNNQFPIPKEENDMKFEVLPAVKMSMLVFWVVTPCGLAVRYQRLRGTYCLHLQGWKWRKYVAPKRCYPPLSPQGVTTQKINMVKENA